MFLFFFIHLHEIYRFQKKYIVKLSILRTIEGVVPKIIVWITVLVISSCFDTHPYDVNIKGESNINARQMAIIESQCANKETIRVAFISDTHLWLNDAKDQVEDLNRRGDIDFVVHCGDLTDTATGDEFEWSRDILLNLHYPFVALIGNHDFLGTGNQTYQEIYGEMNFSFIAGRVKFVCINTNATEYDYLAAVPDFDYMEDQMTRDRELFDRTIVVMHAPPYGDQFNNNVCKAFRRYLDLFPGLMFCVNGHDHGDKVSAIYGDDLLFYGIDCATHRNYRIFTITPNGYEVERVYF